MIDMATIRQAYGIGKLQNKQIMNHKPEPSQSAQQLSHGENPTLN